MRDLDLANLQDHSQQGEQAMIACFLKETKLPYTPFFVDVGAFDGITGSNSRFLAELGWGGIVVEPNPAAFTRLKALYDQNAAITCVSCAVSDYAADAVELLVADGPEGVPDEETWHYSQVSTLNPWHTRHYVENHGFRYHAQTVRVRPLMEILLENNCPRDLAVLCIDCEGEDVKIIPSLDYSQFRPRLLSVESDDHNRSVFCELLAPHGYIEYGHTASNTLFQCLPE